MQAETHIIVGHLGVDPSLSMERDTNTEIRIKPKALLLQVERQPT